MTSEGLGEMFEGDSADMHAGKFPLVSMGGPSGGSRVRRRGSEALAEMFRYSFCLRDSSGDNADNILSTYFYFYFDLKKKSYTEIHSVLLIDNCTQNPLLIKSFLRSHECQIIIY
jgi:hypothetical protein